MLDYRLHIKGDMATARAEITRRLGARAIVGINEYNYPYDTTNATICIRRETLLVHNWFNESPPITEGTGFPAGTLLHFYASE